MHTLPAEKVLKLLLARYRVQLDSRPSTGRGSPFEILILTILSAQTTDQAVDRIRDTLFARFPDIVALARARGDEVETIIHSLGFYHVKALYIIATARLLLEEFNSKVPETMDMLLTLPGVGRKTANIVLYHAFGKNEGVAIDTHVKRIVKRIGLTDSSNPVTIERDLMEVLPRKWWGLLTDLLIAHGRACCTARKPRCELCPISAHCRYYRERGSGHSTATSPSR
ncbi:MAG: endonuclease III [Methanomicrobiales archaeon]|nr:endonuclease III [Methanomicrobiales archaeon]